MRQTGEMPNVARCAYARVADIKNNVGATHGPTWLLSFLVRVEVGKTALSLGERVDRDGAFTSRRGPGEGSVRRGSKPGVKQLSSGLLCW
jgi:hypothetical protein